VTDQLRTLLADAAGGARNYADADAAIASARRSRTRRRLVAVPVAAAAVALGAVAALAPHGRGPAPASPDYPRIVAAPQRPPALPAGRLGPASLVYAPCARDCDPILVLPDGTQYALERPQHGGPTAGYTLSPDGRWLGRSTADGVALRNLDTAVERDLPDDGPGVSEVWAWSPDSTRVLLVRHTDGVVAHFEVVDVGSGDRRRVTGGDLNPVGVRDAGTVLLWNRPGAGAPRLTVADVSSGTLVGRQEITPDLSSLLRPGETAATDSLRLGPGGAVAMLAVAAPVADDDLRRPQAVQLLDLTDGHAVARLDLPAGAGRAGELWEPRAMLVGGILLAHHTSGRVDVVRLNDVTGARTVLCTLPGSSQVVLRGGGR